MGVPQELIEVRQILFKDYCNQRDRIKRVMKKPGVQLTKDQSIRVLQLARKQMNQRELVGSRQWYQIYRRNVQCYLMAIRVECWPAAPWFKQ